MNCPNCTQPMERGTAMIERSSFSFFMGGRGSMHLAFKSDTGRKSVVMTSRDVNRSYYCRACGAIAIATAPRSA